MGNMFVFIIVVFSGIYGFYVIYKQIKTGKCSCCPEKKNCSINGKAECQEKKSTANKK